MDLTPECSLLSYACIRRPGRKEFNSPISVRARGTAVQCIGVLHRAKAGAKARQMHVLTLVLSRSRCTDYSNEPIHVNQ